MSRFPRGTEFPNEGFVVAAIRAYALHGGGTLADEPDVDVAYTDGATGSFVRVEAKGMTTAPGLDFNTCVGQILKRMDRDDARYAIAVPDVPAYRRQTSLVPERVRRLLQLEWLFVSPDGNVEEVRPPLR